ncbi:MAG TPA: hypothetical protein VFT64_12470 [Rickettsiales bacterium]|nr:hypothetical protein [Rickettsiales bacterium]
MRLNPELQRYGWLEFSWQRLLIAPALLAAIYLLASRTPIIAMQLIIHLSKYGFLILVLLWGGNKAARCVTEEVAANTWDWQRLSSLSPPSLAFGKIAGNAIYNWYAGALCLGLYVWGCAQTGQPTDLILRNCTLLVTGGILCQTVALLASLITMQEAGVRRKRYASLGVHIAGLLAALIPLRQVNETVTVEPLPGSNMEHIWWYGSSYPETGFVTVTTLLACAWAIAGIYWQMRGQLRMRTGPWLWAAFGLFAIGFCAGFDIGALNGKTLAFTVSLALFYIIAILEQWDGLTWRKLLTHWKNGKRMAFSCLLPRWVISLVFCSLITAYGYIRQEESPLLFSAQLVFAMRDIALLHYFHLHPKNARANASTILTLAILYILLPWLAFTAHKTELMLWFMPLSAAGHTATPVISGIIQTAIILVLVYWRWRNYWGNPTTATRPANPPAQAQS